MKELFKILTSEPVDISSPLPCAPPLPPPSSDPDLESAGAAVTGFPSVSRRPYGGWGEGVGAAA